MASAAQKKGGKAGAAAADAVPDALDASGPNEEEGGEEVEAGTTAAQLPADPFAVEEAPAPHAAAEPEAAPAPVKAEEPAPVKKEPEAAAAPKAAETAGAAPVPAHQGEPKGEEKKHDAHGEEKAHEAHEVNTHTSNPGDCFQALVPGILGVSLAVPLSSPRPKAPPGRFVLSPSLTPGAHPSCSAARRRKKSTTRRPRRGRTRPEQV